MLCVAQFKKYYLLSSFVLNKFELYLISINLNIIKMDKRNKGNIILSGNKEIDKLRIDCINKILLFDNDINYDLFDFLFGNFQSRPKRLIKLLISLDCLENLDKIAGFVFKKCEC